MRILVAEDDEGLREVLVLGLTDAGYHVDAVDRGDDAIDQLKWYEYDVAVIDWRMPGAEGIDVVAWAREHDRPTGLLMLTARDTPADRIRGLDLGADDYLTKPFSPRTLLARVRALLRRSGVEKPSPISAGDFTVDVESQTVSIQGHPAVRLTSLELRLLQFLLANGGHPMPAERLATHVWGYRGMGDRQLLKQLVHRLRQKIEKDPSAPRYLLTVSGVGYLIHPVPKDPP